MWLPLAAVVGVLVYLYGFFGYLTAYGPHLSVARSMISLYGYDEWQHCALVPFLAAFLVWWKRDSLATLQFRPSLLGLVPVAGAFVLFWMSYRLDDIYVAFASIQTMVAGLIILFLGWAWMKALLFPWLFLVFAWPLFFLDNLIAFPLRMVMSLVSTGVLNVIGISAVQIGTSIHSAGDPITGTPQGQLFQVDVADPCSGIRSLFALMMVSALYGFFAMKSWWKHLLLFASSIPLAIAGNLVRILMLTVGILIMGPEAAIGTLEEPSFYHMFSGFFVFAVALGGMFLIASLLNGEHLRIIDYWKKHRVSDQGSASPDFGRRVDAPRETADIY